MNNIDGVRKKLLEAYSLIEEAVNELAEMEENAGSSPNPGPAHLQWRDVIGFHVNPVMGDHGNVRVVNESELKQVASISSWAVMNFNRDWWQSSMSMRDDMIGVVKTAHDYFGLKLIIRLEDPDVVRPYNEIRVDPKWWGSRWALYVESVCEALHGRVYAYQVMNEVWCKGSEVVWDHGGAPRAEEYVEFLGMCRTQIKGIDPSVRVLNAGITTVTERRYWDYVRPLLDAGWLEESDGVNVHLYWREPHDSTGRLKRLAGMTGNSPLYITEANHLDRFAGPPSKFNVIRGISEAARLYFEDRLQCVCAFCANYSDHLKGWEILGTPLYDLLGEWSEEEI